MEYRGFGKTGTKVSTIGLGGGFLNSVSFDEGKKIVLRAWEGGINYFDTAPSYSDGESERIISEVLGKHKEHVFIATKVLARSYENAKKEIQGSLERLGKIDLAQLHAVDTTEALDAVFGPKGALRAVEEAKAGGLVKFIGVTNHFDPRVVQESLERYPFDAITIPLGVISLISVDFRAMAESAKSRGLAVIGMKIFGVETMRQRAGRALRYSLSQPASTILIGPATVKELENDLEIAEKLEPLGPRELEELRNYAKSAIRKEAPWWQQKPVGVRNI